MSKKLKKIINDDRKYLFQNYGDRLPVCFTRGMDSYLYDQDNYKYIDFFSGIAVSALGYGDKSFQKHLCKQIGNIIHSSNWYYNREQAKAAKLISELSFPGKTLFVNSGTEANEAAIKLVRKYGLSGSPSRYEIISFAGSFHGRTFGSMSATGQERIRTGFGPLVPGFIFLPFNDIDAVKKEINNNPNICAVITELIQGEGGINLAQKKFIEELFTTCREKGIISIADEIQTGIGRTGRLFAYQHFDIKPDIITLAKGLGGGVPVGALHTGDELSKFFERGVHGTTFGGGQLACAAVCYILKKTGQKTFLNKIKQKGDYIVEQLHELKQKSSIITNIRGLGLHIGMELNKPGMDLVKKALEHRLVINCTAEKVIRIMPPLSISMKTIKEGMKILKDILLDEDEKF